jgi:hypothetical protein
MPSLNMQFRFVGGFMVTRAGTLASTLRLASTLARGRGRPRHMISGWGTGFGGFAGRSGVLLWVAWIGLGRMRVELRVLRLSLLQDGNIGIGIFPKGEEIFVGGERPEAGGISVRTLRGLGL